MGKYNETNKKLKKKLRAMTYGEFCHSTDKDCDECPLKFEKCGFKENEPYKPNGKYIFIEVKE